METKNLSLNFICEYLVNIFQEMELLTNELEGLDKNSADYDIQSANIKAKIAGLDKQIKDDLQDFKEKADSYAYAIKHFDTNAEVCRAEARRLMERAKSLENTAKRIKENLSNQMQFIGIDKFKSEKHNFYFMTRKGVNVDCAAERLPEDFRREKIEYSADKDAIKKAIESGVELPFASLYESKSLVIK